MNKKTLMRILFSGRVLILISFLLMSVFAIGPNFSSDGLLVKTVDSESSAEVNGIESDEI